MTTSHTHPHAEFDRFPQLLEDLAAEFGRDGIEHVVEHFIDAEYADLHWDARLAEMNLGAWESLDDEEEAFERVAILGYFRAEYYVAVCIVDAERHVRWMFGKHRFDRFDAAAAAFQVGGG